MAKTNVQTNLLGRKALLTDENAAAAQRYLDCGRGAGPPLPWTTLHPEGGEVVAVFTDREGSLNVTLSTPEKLVTLEASWLKVVED